ncbi:hypothetical protein SAMN06265375_1011256 [Muriicola jejuensis]|uniref:Leucine-rich repeat domain-containing protein n=1 Tax=Muriicola jejuensis TaxID=504488 RepID=A0A6P0U9L9_9FLAO|nr:hypothetical protein [Muriicola jejuensis]NER09252.1 hypothetical protein [Muriicola jejuensis]SMP09975.1 hypothetical protein SAMN06265375_1011256 [Muriicola jejuensis]
MKKYIAFSLAVIGLFALSCSNDGDSGSNQPNIIIKPRTAIADAAFEQALVDLGIDDVVDGSVLTENAEMVTSLVMDNKGITSLQGISDFTMLENLSANNNQISSLDLSANTALKFVFVNNNDLTSINVTGLAILEKLSIPGNNVTLLNISGNTALQLLDIKDNTLGAIDLSNIPNSLQLNTFAVENNPLTCIRVNSEILNDIPSQWTKDPEDNYALTCN